MDPDPESGKILPPETIGMLEVKGPNVFAGYWRMPEKTKTEFRAVKRDMRQARVHRIFDSDGKQLYDIGHYEKRSYTPCTDRRFGWLYVSYKDGRVASKDVSWGPA